MMKLFTTTMLIALLGLDAWAQNVAPVVSNVQAQVSGGLVNVTYNLADNEGDASEVRLLISADGGQTFKSANGTVTGHAGYPVTPGNGKQLSWNFDTINNILAYTVRVVANDRQGPTVQEIVDQVDSNRLKNDLLYVSGIRHYSAGTAHLEAVKDSIEARFAQHGLATLRQDFQKLGYTGQNIIGNKNGSAAPDTTLIIDAHFDSVDDAPGADDNGSGVVGVLEALRVLAPYTYAKNIRFIGFDFEETGLDGSRKYVQDGLPAGETIEGVANFEMIGYYSNQPNSQQVPAGFNLLFAAQYAELAADSFRGNFITNTGSQFSTAFSGAYDSLSAIHVPALKVITVNLPGAGLIAPDFRRSDHASFWDANIPAVMLTDAANFRNPNYHTPGDSIGTLDFTFMSNVVKGTVATIASLAGIQHSGFADAGVLPSSIPAGTLNCHVKLYPVPVNQQLTLSETECLGNAYTVTILDINGKVMLSKRMNTPGNAVISVAGLAAGTYFAVAENKEGKAVTRFVKQ